MNADDYQQATLRTWIGDEDDRRMRIVNAIFGLNGEAGELAEDIKKHWFHGHELTREQICKELGDVQYYISVAAKEYGISLSEVMQTNIDKLMERFPNGFTHEDSRNRKENNE